MFRVMMIIDGKKYLYGEFKELEVANQAMVEIFNTRRLATILEIDWN